MAKIKLKDYLKKKFPDLSSRVIKRALEQGACLINGKLERFATRLVDPQKDKIEYKDIRPEAIEKLLIQKERFIYEDKYFLAYDKEGGHPVMATEKKSQVHLHGELEKFLKQKLFPVHRLDKNTSGLVIFAKSSDACAKLSELFKERKIKKQYQAIVDGLITGSGTIKNYLGLETKTKNYQVWQNFDVDEITAKKKNYKSAETEYEVLKNYKKKNCSHILFKPQTGRTHQLRLHAVKLGHPILGDTVYATKFKSKLMPSRHLLHASALEFNHPYTEEKLFIEAPLAADMINGVRPD